MKPLLIRLLSLGPLLQWLRELRYLRDQIVDQQIRQLRQAVRRLRKGDVDVLILGDSSTLYVDQTEEDPRRLGQMIQDELGPDVSVATIAGPGSPPRLRAELIRVLTTLENRPKAVLLSIAPRTATAVHILRHPDYGYPRTLKYLSKVADADARLFSVSPHNRATKADFAEFHAQPVTTRWRTASSIGEFQRNLRGRRGAAEDIDRQRMLFDYFHGEIIGPDHPALADLAELGRRLRVYGVPVVLYQPPIPVERGEQYFPGEFAAHVDANSKTVLAAVTDELGDLVDQVEQDQTPDEEFIDASDGSEHWNYIGRRKMAKVLADHLRQAIEGGR